MKNFEKYEKEIKEIYEKDYGFGIVNGKPVPCGNAEHCNDCKFYEGFSHCTQKQIKWLYSEHKESIVLTPFEHEVLKRIKNAGLNFIAKDGDSKIHAFHDIPNKEEIKWKSIERMTIGEWMTIGSWLDCFHFIKWEDDEPYSIDELLKCEVKS